MKAIRKIKAYIYERKRKKTWAQAKEIYQIMEYQGELWITVYGSLCVPRSMISCGDILKAVDTLRLKYFARQMNEI